MIDFELKQNARTADLGFATDERCGRCGCISSAYLEIVIAADDPCALFANKEVICKGCLLNGVDVIDKGLLDQAKKKV
jgi:hypothetical protein